MFDISFYEWSYVNSNSVIDKKNDKGLFHMQNKSLWALRILNVINLPEPKVQGSLSNLFMCLLVRPSVCKLSSQEPLGEIHRKIGTTNL